MTAPETQFEQDGTWTTREAEDTFWAQIAADTEATVTVGGHSVQDRPIHRVDLGNPNGSTYLLVALQHGNEMAPREGVLAFMRDMAYSTDPDVVDYLAEHRITVLSPVNTDRIDWTRGNDNNVNINRDHYQITQPETVAIADAIRDTNAALIVDCHGRDDLNTGRAWEAQSGGHLAAHGPLSDISAEFRDHLFNKVEGQGWTTRAYPPSRTPTLSRAMGLYHAAGIVSETWGPQDSAERIQIMRYVLEEGRKWHAVNITRLENVRAASRAAAQSNTGAYVLETEAIPSLPLNPPPTRYVPSEPLPEQTVEALGIVVDPDGTIPMAQEARGFLPLILDPSSEYQVVPAVRVQPDTPIVDLGPPADLRRAGRVVVMVDGAPREAAALIMRVGDAMRTIWQRAT